MTLKTTKNSTVPEFQSCVSSISSVKPDQRGFDFLWLFSLKIEGMKKICLWFFSACFTWNFFPSPKKYFWHPWGKTSNSPVKYRNKENKWVRLTALTTKFSVVTHGLMCFFQTSVEDVPRSQILFQIMSPHVPTNVGLRNQ